jgi:hypothetical protein
MPPNRCQTNKDIDSSSKVCDTGARWTGMYCKGCRERMMGKGTWTEAHAKRQSELNALLKEKARAYRVGLSMEEKEARLAHKRVYAARNRDAVNAAQRQRLANKKLDPVKWEAFKQRKAVADRKHRLKAKAETERERKRARTSADDDDDDEEELAEVQSVIPGDNVIVISDDEDEGAVEVAVDSSGSDVEGIEFVSSDDEHEQ